jgi:nucleoid-associated protein YgaU
MQPRPSRGPQAGLGLAYLVMGLAAMFGVVSVELGGPQLPTAWPGAPTLNDIEIFLWSPSRDQVASVLAILTWAIWLCWGYVFATTVLRVLVVVAERVGSGAAWVRSFRWVSDLVTVPAVRRAVDASLAGALFVRVATGVSAHEVVVAPSVAQVQVYGDGQVVPPAAPTWSTQSRHLMFAPDRQPGDVLYEVQSGDSLWSITKYFFGSGEEWPVVYGANIDRRQPDGRTFTEAGQIRPGWVLLIPSPPQPAVEIDVDGKRWYTVRGGDNLWSISARCLGDGRRWPEVFDLNRGARSPDGHTLVDPDIIWPDLRLQLPDDVPAGVGQPTNEQVPTEPDRAPAVERPSPVPTPEAAPTVATPTAVPTPPTPPPAAAPMATAWSVATPEPVVTEAPVRTTPAGGPALSADGELLAGSAAILGLSLAVLLGLRASRRRWRRSRAAGAGPDEAGAQLRPAALLAGGGEDPYGIRVAERLGGALIERARAAGLNDMRVVSGSVGEPALVLVLEAAPRIRDEVEGVLGAASELARRVEVSSSDDRDLVVRLDEVRLEASLHSGAQDPLLLCVGMRPDRRYWVVGWELLGHLLVASERGSLDAREHLAAVVASLAARRPPDRVRLYTVAASEDALGQLAGLPHQAVVTGPGETARVEQVLASLRSEVQRRQESAQSPDEGSASLPELVVVLSELGHISAVDDLAYLLAHGRDVGLRVLAATADPAVADRTDLLAAFDSRFVGVLGDEALSMALLGTPWALALAGPGNLLARLGHRGAVEILGARLDDAARRELLAALRGTGSVGTVEVPPAVPAAPTATGSVDGQEVDHGVAPPTDPQVPSLSEVSPGATPSETEAEQARDSGDALARAMNAELNGHQNGATSAPATLEPLDGEESEREAGPPPVVALLGSRTRIVMTCADGGLWHAGSRLHIPEGRGRELLLRLAAAPALKEPVANQRDRIVAELRHGRDEPRRDDDNASASWLNVTGKRLGFQLAKAVGVDDAAATEWSKLVVVDRQTGEVSLQPELVLSDVQAFVSAASKALDAKVGRGERVAAAEEALAVGLPLLGDEDPQVLPSDLPERHSGGVVAYAWARQDAWERDAPAYLVALWQKVALTLARVHSDAGQHAAAAHLFGTVLDRDPLHRNAQEGLLLAAARSAEPSELEAAWARVRKAWEDEVPIELDELHERLQREVAGAYRADR